ncbi:LmbU family transcriptional regulator [Streptomyces sp. NPDC059455]|uniref:LmbU family transcriptional regulator n=1 Tax=Streptomyces sp. NPDC059455 TaxID=3346837 RepID=UPI0036CEF913
MGQVLTSSTAGNRSGGANGSRGLRVDGAGNREGWSVRAGLGADGIQARRVELHLPAGLTFESWRHIGCNLTMITNSSGWWLGDWLVYGEKRFPDRYRVVLKETTLDYQTLRNYAWVARRFPACRRRDALSLQHHAEVAALPEPEQGRWLTRAEEEKWSTRRLRKELRQARELSGDTSSKEAPINLVMSLDLNRKDLWTQAAAAVDMPLLDWITKVLDDAAVPVD